MKTTCEVFDRIEEIAQVSGNAKDALIAKSMDESDLFTDVCKVALDPFITYGVKKLPEPTEGFGACMDFNPTHWSTLGALSERKLTGGEAQKAIADQLGVLSEKSQELFRRIIKKDLRASFSAKSLNRHKPGTVFIFDCMLAQKFDPKRIKEWPVMVEPKFDGVRALAIYKDRVVRFYSRTGKEYPNYGHIASQLKAAIEKMGWQNNDFIFDGEIMDGEFNETVGSMRRTGADTSGATYYIFEVMSLDHFDDGCEFPAKVRRSALNKFYKETFDVLPSVEPTEVRVMYSVDEIMEWNEEIQSDGGEGVIVKPVNGMYVRKRSYDWLKVKGHIAHDLVVTGVFEGEGKFENSLGGLIVDFEGTTVKVGSGLTDADREAIWADPLEYVGRIAEIFGHELTPDGSIRHPVFKRWRDDKPIEDGKGV